MMMKMPSSLDIEAAVEILCKSVNETSGNNAEIFQLITQLPDITGSFLPFDLLQKDSDDDSNQNLRVLVETIAKYYCERIKYLLEDCIYDAEKHVSNPGRVESICQCIECLILIGGPEYAKVKFSGALSRRTDAILQNEMQHAAGTLEDMKLIEENFTNLIKNAKTFALDAIWILFSCQELNLTSDQLINYISDPILEKLSVELLTLVDTLKSSVSKTSPNSTMQSIGNSSQTNLFTVLTATIGEDGHFSPEKLIALANIISLFLDLESSMRLSQLTMFLKTQSKNERSIKSSLRSRSQLPDLLRSSQESSWLRSSQIYGNWNWQEILKDIGSITAKSIVKIFEDYQMNSISSAKTAYDLDEYCNLPMMQSISSTILSGPGIPKQTMSCFGEVLKLMKLFLPFAVLGSQYKPLSGLCSCYVDECGQSLKNMKSFLMTLINDFPNKTSISNMYQVLATCEDSCTILSFCASKMDPEPRIPFQGISQLYRDLNDMVKKIIMQHQTVKLSTRVLNDSESHHWTDPREFNEGESCSYSIKMWDLFLKQLLNELGSSVSETQRTKIFGHIFMNSLQFLEVRYVRCEPSYNRTKQILLDVTTILAICRKYIFNGSFGTKNIFFNDLPESMLDARFQISQILESCKTLLTVLCVISSPIDVFEKYLSTSRTLTSATDRSSFSYLSLLYPSIIPTDWNGHFAHLPDESVISCILEYTQFRPMSLVCCFYALVLRKQFLLKKILSKEFVPSVSKADIEGDIYNIFASSSSNFQDVFFQCAYKSVCESADTLLDFCLPSDEGTDVDKVWQKKFHASLEETICNSMGSVGRYISNLTWSSFGLELISSLPPSLKNPVTNLSGNENTDDKNFEMAAILLLIQGVELAVYATPNWLLVFLARAKDATKTLTNVDLMFDNGAFHIIIHAVCYILKKPSMWEQYHGIVFNQQGTDCMQRLSELLLKLCYKHTNKQQAGLEVLVVKELENLEQKITAACYNISLGPDYTEEQLYDICQQQVSYMEAHCKLSIESLTRISNMICDNQSLIHKLCNVETQSSGFIVSKKKYKTENNFDPIVDYNDMDEYGVGDEIDWHVMCSKILPGVHEKTLKSMLSHRWEMKEGAYLNEDQSGIILRLRTFLEMPSEVC